MASKKDTKKIAKKKTSILPIAIVIVVAVLVIIIIAIVTSNNSPKINNGINNNANNPSYDNSSAVGNTVQQTIQNISNSIKRETCEEMARKLIPSTITLTKNSLDPKWGADPANKTINKWTDGTAMVPVRFLRYQITAQNTYVAEKPVIVDNDTHYFVYTSAEKIIFEINPILEEIPGSLQTNTGYGGELFYTEKFSIKDVGIVSCISAD